MHVTQNADHLRIRDRPGAHWFLGLFLLAGGLVGIAAPLGLAQNADRLKEWERAASLIVGVGVSAGALWWLARSPSSRVDLDLTRRRLRITRIGLSGRQVQELAFDDLAGVATEQSRDIDGDPVTRPVVHLKSGTTVPLSALWSHDERGVAGVVEAIMQAVKR